MGVGTLVWVVLWFLPGYIIVRRKGLVEQTIPAILLSSLLSITVPFYISYVLSAYANASADVSFLAAYLIAILLSLTSYLRGITDKFSR